MTVDFLVAKRLLTQRWADKEGWSYFKSYLVRVRHLLHLHAFCRRSEVARLAGASAVF